MEIFELTPVEYNQESGIWLKRDDLFEVCGVRGGKARAAYQVISELLKEGYTSIVTAGSRQSPQCEIVSFICEQLKVECNLFMPFGEDTSVITHVKQNKRTTVHRVKPGYNSVIIGRAKEFARNNDCGYVPFGMECAENVEVTSKQVINIPKEVERVVIPVGSGMSFSSVVTGMFQNGINLPILGVQVGKDPTSIIEEYAEGIWFMDYNIVKSEVDYHTPVEAFIGEVELDPIYEAKCFKYLKKGDLLWIVGHRL